MSLTKFIVMKLPNSEIKQSGWMFQVTCLFLPNQSRVVILRCSLFLTSATECKMSVKISLFLTHLGLRQSCLSLPIQSCNLGLSFDQFKNLGQPLPLFFYCQNPILPISNDKLNQLNYEKDHTTRDPNLGPQDGSADKSTEPISCNQF